MSLKTYSALWGAPSGGIVSMGEGSTPLVRSSAIGPSLGLDALYFKLESSNPTGSYKDRFAAAAVSHLVHDGRTLCLGTSSGNTGAAVAAYCARARIACWLAIVDTAPEGKLRQMLSYGARLVRIRKFGSSPEVSAQVMQGLARLAQELGAGLEISAFTFSPRGMAGVSTISFELADQLDSDRFHVFSPSGGGGLTLAVARGFSILAKQRGWPRQAHVHCVQPEGNDTIATPLSAGDTRARAVQSKTLVSGLQVGGVLDGNDVIDACRTSGGTGHVVTDEEVWAWQMRLAREEGIFCEPAGAVALAGLAKAAAAGTFPKHEPAVCLVTGSGFKDENALNRLAAGPGAPVLESFEAFEAQVRSAVGRP